MLQDRLATHPRPWALGPRCQLQSLVEIQSPDREMSSILHHHGVLHGFSAVKTVTPRHEGRQICYSVLAAIVVHISWPMVCVDIGESGRGRLFHRSFYYQLWSSTLSL